MPKKLNSVIGIDIGSQTIKVAELKAAGKEPSLTAMGMTATPEGAVDHTGIFNPDAVASALKGLLAETGTSVPFAVVSIAGQASVLVRTLEVPRMNPNELREHMAWEINRNIPFAESTVQSDFRALPDDDPNSPNMDVVMAISPQSAIDSVIASVKKAGKNVAAIDVEPLAIARALEFAYSDLYGGQTVCVIDIGSKTTSINIYRGSKLLMPRLIPIGGEMFTRAIADGTGVSMQDAEATKLQRAAIPETAGAGGGGAAFGAATGEFQPYNPFSDEPAPAEPPPQTADATPVPAAPSGDPVFNSFSSVLDEAVAEIRRSVDWFRSRGSDIQHVLLAGGATRLNGLPGYLHRALGVPCDEFDPTRRLNVNLRKVAPGFVEEHRQEFAVAIGNALHVFFD